MDRLAAAERWTYRASRESAAEPAAWAALALTAHGRVDAALRPAAWLAELQQRDGAVGVSVAEETPRWPTSLAMLAWNCLDRRATAPQFQPNIEAAARWALADHGKTAPRSPQIGHDTTLRGWSWAAETHSWLEPTCLFVIGLAAAGFGEHSRIREGVRLVHDRLLAAGGANYGNTIVLGQPLLPHVQPTGLAMLALAGEADANGRIEKSLAYLERSTGPHTAAASLSFSCLGLTAHGRRPLRAGDWIGARLAAAADGALSVYERALLLLAARTSLDWLPASGGLAALPCGELEAASHSPAGVAGRGLR